MRPFILHAHFYQPERLNPWTGALDPEPTAAPDRDWNQRILRECYAPNGAARIFDEDHHVERILNNYERLSFNFGPTLLSWLEVAAPHTYAKVLDGDLRGTVRLGHGQALAQAYNHMILPLANERDRWTQIVWGIADFHHRFKRQPEGMWLPEAAIDPATVDALIDAGISFIVLAPTQAARVQDAEGNWHEGEPDSSRPYRVRHRHDSDRYLAVFFYDGALSQSLAFDPATGEAAVLVDRLASTPGDGLINAALDGETFGHHHAFGELGLAYALFELAPRRGLVPTNYAAIMEQSPPTLDAEVMGGEGSAWSCPHGVGRWYRDCGCATDSQPGWTQQWRGPLRQALDLVRDHAAEVFQDRGGALLRNPWAARDDYIHVHLGEWTRDDFLQRHTERPLDDDECNDVWTLLEAQRHAMVMYTSCGWFFADISGIETVYVLRSAARVLGLIEELGEMAPRTAVLEVLAHAPSNKPEVGSGADVWRTKVAPAEATPTRLASLQREVIDLLLSEQSAAVHGGASAEALSSLAELRVDAEALTAVRHLFTLADTQGYQLKLTALPRLLSATLAEAARVAAHSLELPDVETFEGWFALCTDLNLAVDFSLAQEAAYEAAVRARMGQLLVAQHDMVARLGRRLGLSPQAWAPADSPAESG